jgi:mono/diheme cytochrome c family protein
MHTPARLRALGAACFWLLLPLAGVAQGDVPADPVARGRYLAQVGGCNDCHTPGYIESAGATPEQDWLTGDRLGWQGPWGTTYPVNLRRYMAGLTEAEWVERARRLSTRPPMPWFNVRRMSEADLRAFYRYVRSLGPAGEAAPAFVPPGQAVAGPVVRFPVASQ